VARATPEREPAHETDAAPRPDAAPRGADDHASNALEAVRDSVSDAATHVAEAVKPRLRGWIHAGTFPFALVASIVLVVIAPPVAGKVSCAIFGLTACLLFGTSAVYHRGTWSPRVAGILRRADHSNIFLIIAGTYTPLAVLLLPQRTATILLVIVWGGALLGLLARILWLDAPRWVYVPIYVALGWVAVGDMPQFWTTTNGPAIVWLVAAGGLAYTLGAVVYGIKRPNPSPRWFGFHEIFHVLTVVGFTCHFVAITLAAVAAG
jgi:hemolysin III